MTSPAPLKRQLGLAAVAAVVMGNMLGSGVFFTPGELAAVAQHPWQVHFIWALSGVITLCGALTLAELCSRFPQAGASYHIIREGFGPFWGFLLVWVELWVDDVELILSVQDNGSGFLEEQAGVVEQLRCALSGFDQLRLQVQSLVQIFALHRQRGQATQRVN